MKVPPVLKGINNDFLIMFNSHVEIKKRMEHKKLSENVRSYLESEIVLMRRK